MATDATNLDSAPCRRCGSRETMTIPLGGRSGPHEFERCCCGCGMHRGWVAKTRDPAEAQRWPMPFGKHKGTPLGELPDDYLSWLVRTCRSRSVADRAELVLRERRAKR